MRLKTLPLNARLCYVDDGVAWFSLDSTNVTGDDWNDAPYECNAGDPYGGPNYPETWRIMFWSTDLATPASRGCNLSVDAINRGAAPWLASGDYTVTIPAGTTLDDFVRIAMARGCEVFWPVEEGPQ